MKYVSWKEALEVAENYQEQGKVTLVMFTDKDCEVCSSFVPDLEVIESDLYQVLVVEDGKTMSFSPTSYPVGYVFIPNCPTQMPMQRVGNAPINMITEDAERQVRSFQQGRDYYEIVESDRKNGS
jgi:hypothetical protein